MSFIKPASHNPAALIWIDFSINSIKIRKAVLVIAEQLSCKLLKGNQLFLGEIFLNLILVNDRFLKGICT